jgi:hypothetical protein
MVTGSVGGTASQVKYATFTVNVVDCCSGTTISSSTISDTSYVVSSSTVTIASLAWTQSKTSCPTAINYTV